MKKNIKTIVDDWTKFQQQYKQGLANFMPWFRFLLWKRQYTIRSPLEMELFKFNPRIRASKIHGLSKLLSAFIGFNLYIYFQRIYEDDQKLREPGYPIPWEHNGIYLYWRIIRIKMHMWFMSNVSLNWGEIKSSDISAQNFEIPKYKEILMKTYQIQNYQQNRDSTFDFLQLGEKENLSNI